MKLVGIKVVDLKDEKEDMTLNVTYLEEVVDSTKYDFHYL